MTKSDIERVQAYLQRLFGTDRLRVVSPVRTRASVDVAIGDEIIGTLHKDVEDGKVSYSVHLTILEEDLPKLVQPANSSAASPRKLTR